MHNNETNTVTLNLLDTVCLMKLVSSMKESFISYLCDLEHLWVETVQVQHELSQAN